MIGRLKPQIRQERFRVVQIMQDTGPVNLFALAGEPDYPGVEVDVYVSALVSAPRYAGDYPQPPGYGEPALRTGTGWDASAIVRLHVLSGGRICGFGGMGGIGAQHLYNRAAQGWMSLSGSGGGGASGAAGSVGRGGPDNGPFPDQPDRLEEDQGQGGEGQFETVSPTLPPPGGFGAASGGAAQNAIFDSAKGAPWPSAIIHDAQDGAPGGDAIYLEHPLTVLNAGEIWGGGGGGAGGLRRFISDNSYATRAGGQGGFPGGDGFVGSVAGDPGAFYIALPGAAGKAVEKNGFVLTYSETSTADHPLLGATT